MDLRDIMHATLWLFHKQNFVSRRLVHLPGLHCAFEMFRIRQNHHHQYPDNNRTGVGLLYQSMVFSQSFEKTELRDSVFAILGLLDRDKLLTDADPALLEVDYAKPLPDILRDATRYTLHQRGDLAALVLAEPCSDSLEEIENMPSWAARIDLRRGPKDLVTLPVFFHVSQGLLDSPNFLTDTTYGTEVLLVEGIVVDQVLQATPLFPESLNTWEILHAGLRKAKAMAVRHCDLAFQEDSIQEYTAMAFAITAAQTSSYTRARAEDLVMLSEYLARLNTNQDATEKPLPHDIQTLIDIYQIVHLYNAFRRQLFVTSEGNMGLGPLSMRADDLVVILRGGYVPFVLRKIGNFYQFKGPAYVHGIMDGEAVETSKARNEPEMLFMLR
jgi:hypothetical protein